MVTLSPIRTLFLFFLVMFVPVSCRMEQQDAPATISVSPEENQAAGLRIGEGAVKEGASGMGAVPENKARETLSSGVPVKESEKERSLLYSIAEPLGGTESLVEALCSMPETGGSYSRMAEELGLPAGCIDISLLERSERARLIGRIESSLPELPVSEEQLHRNLHNWLVANRQLHILAHYAGTERVAEALYEHPYTTDLFDSVLSRRGILREDVTGESVSVMMASAEHENLVRQAATELSALSRAEQLRVFRALYEGVAP